MKNTKYVSIGVAFLFALLSNCIYSQNANTSIFWEVSGNGIEKPSYLYGSIHMISQDDFFLPDSLEELFKSCDQIVLEIDMDAPDFMQKTRQLMVMHDGTIRDFMSEEEYSLLERFFQDSLNMSLEQYQQLKPFFLTQFILPKIINKPVTSYEFTFLQMAKMNQIPLTGLESIEEQMNSLDQIPYKKQAAFVIETIKEFNKSRDLYNDLIKSYKNKDFVDFYRYLFESSKELEEFEQLLLIDRNNMWVPRIEKMIKEQSCFIAVGALHLEGPNGLAESLRTKGYHVRPVQQRSHFQH